MSELVNYVFSAFTQQVSCSCLGDTYHPYGGFVVGVVGGLAYVAWSSLMQLCHVDDPTDVIAGTTYKFINKVTLDSENKNTIATRVQSSLLTCLTNFMPLVSF